MFQIVEDVEICESSCLYSDAHEHMLGDVNWLVSPLNITGVLSCIQNLIQNTRSEIEWDRVPNTEHANNFERRESYNLISILIQ